jgi:hypothetical protein
MVFLAVAMARGLGAMPGVDDERGPRTPPAGHAARG